MSVIPTHPLGPEVSQHRYQATSAILYFVLAALCLLVWVGVTGIGVHEVYTKGDWGALGATFCLGAFFGLPGVWLLWFAVRGLVRGAVVTIHEGGVSWRTRFGEKAWTWDEMTSLRINRVTRSGRPPEEAFDAVTLARGDDTITFDESDFGPLPEASLDLMRERTMLVLVPKYEEQLQAGQTLRFGPVALSHTEVGMGKHRFHVDDIAGWRFQGADLLIQPKHGKGRSVRVFGTPNTHVLFQLLARRAPFQPKG